MSNRKRVNLFVAQSQKYEGDNWWKWSLWIERSDEDLLRMEQHHELKELVARYASPDEQGNDL